MAKPKPPLGKKRSDSQKRRRYGIGRGKGLSRSEAAKRAGYTSKRAARGITGFELDKDPAVQKVMADTMAKDMGEAEVKNRRAAQARGEIPTKVVRANDGVRAEYDSDAALAAVAKILGMNSETHRLELPGDRDEALLEVQKVLALFGVTATVEEISAKLESAGE